MNHLNTRHLLSGFLVLVLAVVLGATFWTRLETRPRQGVVDNRPLEGLKRFGTVPDFSLTDQRGQTFKLSDLRGKVWITDFIYTTCKDTCPMQSAEMAKLQTVLAGKKHAKLISVSVDPQRDTPQVLSRYADRFDADPDRWLFLTGEKKNIYRLVQRGFRLSAVPAKHNNSVVLHSSRFVLVDPRAQIRGYYDSNDHKALRRLRRDLKTLLREEGK
ncbi:MAG: SCO family protein [Candidatus Binatia bacterium]